MKDLFKNRKITYVLEFIFYFAVCNLLKIDITWPGALVISTWNILDEVRECQK